MERTQSPGLAGQAVYTPLTLRLYDSFVLGFSSRFLWRCPSRVLLEHFDRHVSARHLDAGVGTGWFLARAAFPPDASLALVDLNPHCLARAAARVAHLHPVTFREDLLLPLELGGRSFTSISCFYVLHCLPGSMREKAVALDHLAAHLEPGGCLAGATILPRPLGPAARALAAHYNRRGIFCNRNDRFEDLEEALQSRFDDVSITMHGAVALFAARGRVG